MDYEFAPFVLSDFSDMAAWDALVGSVMNENDMGFRAYITPISDRRFENADVLEIVSEFTEAVVVFVVDERALARSEILCVDGLNPTNKFRARAADLWMVENNMTLANMDFEEFIEQVGDDGLLTGI